MYVTKSEKGFSFFIGNRDVPFHVSLWLANDGDEEIRIHARGLQQHLPVLPLEPGSIRSLIGSRRWVDFIRLCDAGHNKIYLSPDET